MIKPWLIWMVFSAILLIVEIFTAGFFLLWFGIAAAVAAFAALAGLSYIFQWGIFIVLSIVLFIFSRPLAEKVTKKQPPGVGADRFIGKFGIVIEEINPEQGTGMVRIKTDEWRADSATGNLIAKDERVVVAEVDGTHLVVEKCS